MSRIIPKEVLERIRDANDIVEVVQRYLPLHRAGSNYKTLCPFHKEKTPSFHVNPARQIFHCFGCGKGGDVFRFITEYERVDFATAVRMLADRVGITVDWDESASATTIDKQKLYRVLEDAATYFHATLLKSSEAAGARAYLKSRHLEADAVNEFLIGYALPPPRNRLLTWAKAKKHPLELLETAGLLARAENGSELYDRFSDRVMFPIRDEIGRVVGFSGRTLKEDAGTAKYVNSPETPVFKKRRILFALDRARKKLAETRVVILCEGQIDTIRCHLAGFDNTVATQGTALTEDHARLLKRFVDSVIIVMDADEAGEKAALRSAEVLLAGGLNVQIAALPLDEDPDSLIRAKGPRAFQAVLDSRRSLIAFLVEVLKKQGDFRDPTYRLRAARHVLETIARAPESVQQSLMVEEAAQCLGVPVWTLRRDLRRHRVRPTDSRDEAAAGPPVSHPQAEVSLCELLLHAPAVAPLVRQYLHRSFWTDPACLWIAERLLEWSENPALEPVSRLAETDQITQELAARILSSPPKITNEFTPEQTAQDLICRIASGFLERKKKHLHDLIAGASEAERRRYRMESMLITLDLGKIREGWQEAMVVLKAYSGEAPEHPSAGSS